MRNFIFEDCPQKFDSETAFIGHIALVDGKDALLLELSKKLIFPEYFGYNWDALVDCLRDLHWIEKKKIFIVHDEFPNLQNEALKTYIGILRESIEDWRDCADHELFVVFSEKDRERVKTNYNN